MCFLLVRMFLAHQVASLKSPLELVLNLGYSQLPLPWDRVLVSVIARVRNSGVQENFYFKPYLQKGVTCVFISINSSTFFKPVVARKERQNFIYKQNRT